MGIPVATRNRVPFFSVFRIGALLAGLLASGITAGAPDTLRLAVANTAVETGVVKALLDDFRRIHPEIDIELIAVSGLVALNEARKGRADLVITHHRPSEEQFVAEGYGLDHVLFMYNEFAIFGPPSDPLELRRQLDPHAAMRRLAQAKAEFLAPTVQSGTGRKLIQLWDAAGVVPNWPAYQVSDASTNTTLHLAASRGAYALADMGVYFSQRGTLAGKIAPLYRDHPLLRNNYSAIVVNPARVEGVRADLARLFLDYLTSETGQELIAEYGEQTYQNRLYTPAAHLDPGVRATRLTTELRRQKRSLQIAVLVALVLVALSLALAVLMRRTRRAEAARRASEERFVLAVSGTSDAIWDWDPKTGEVYFSPRWKEILGYTGRDNKLRNTIEDWKQHLHPDDRELVLSLFDNYLAGRIPHFYSQHRLRTQHGNYIWVLERCTASRDPQGQVHHLTGATTDITEHRLQADQAEHQSLYDLQTELPNRSLFLDRTEHALLASVRHNTRCVVLVIGLDGFQEAFAAQDRARGDAALREIAQRLQLQLRRTDTAARIGNDEFGILLTDSDMAHATLPLHRIIHALERPLPLDGERLVLPAFIGVAVYPEHGGEADTLLQHATVALHNARRTRAPYCVYTPVQPLGPMAETSENPP